MAMKRWVQNMQILLLHPRVLGRALGNAVRTLAGQSRLRGVDIELTQSCPCTCAHCYADSLPAASEPLPLATVEAVAAQAVALGALNVNLTGGEPLMRRDLEAAVAICARQGLFTGLCTSGAGLTERRLRALHIAGLHGIYFSLDAADAGAHDRSRGMPGLFDRVQSLLPVARELGMYVAFNTVASREALRSGDLERLRRMALAAGATLNLTMPAPVGRWRDRSDIVLQAEDRRLLAQFMRRTGVRTDTDSTLGATGCPAGNQKLVVDAQGTIKPCQLLDVSFGSVQTDGLARARARMQSHRFMQRRYAYCPAADAELGDTQAAIYRSLSLGD